VEVAAAADGDDDREELVDVRCVVPDADRVRAQRVGVYRIDAVVDRLDVHLFPMLHRRSSRIAALASLPVLRTPYSNLCSRTRLAFAAHTRNAIDASISLHERGLNACGRAASP
jgi:hypothetical protein